MLFQRQHNIFFHALGLSFDDSFDVVQEKLKNIDIVNQNQDLPMQLAFYFFFCAQSVFSLGVLTLPAFIEKYIGSSVDHYRKNPAFVETPYFLSMQAVLKETETLEDLQGVLFCLKMSSARGDKQNKEHNDYFLHLVEIIFFIMQTFFYKFDSRKNIGYLAETHSFSPSLLSVDVLTEQEKIKMLEKFRQLTGMQDGWKVSQELMLIHVTHSDHDKLRAIASLLEEKRLSIAHFRFDSVDSVPVLSIIRINLEGLLKLTALYENGVRFFPSNRLGQAGIVNEAPSLTG